MVYRYIYIVSVLVHILGVEVRICIRGNGTLYIYVLVLNELGMVELLIKTLYVSSYSRLSVTLKLCLFLDQPWSIH